MGVGAVLTGDQTPGVTAVDVVSCAVNWVTTLYKSGARNFLFQNVSGNHLVNWYRTLTQYVPFDNTTDDPTPEDDPVFV